ncbi:family 10 glycosylhydrolase, partial [Acutalibacter muris]
MAWWRENNLRLVQINMRDIDGGMDVDKLIAELKEFCCSVVMVGAGGISAFYPTRLEFQRTSPWLEDRDLLGEIIEKCHREGIRVIARFDFSKTHQSFFRRHPEWYYRSEDGRAVPYNDTVATCVCGEYQQERALEIIGEVLQGYPVDGIFFNMFGFITWDYSGNYYGPCHCDCCKKRFAEFSGGKELPKTEDPGEPDFREYRAFQEQVVEELLGRVHRLVRSYGDDIAVCTYHHSDVDIIRDESNSAVDRPLPFWLYNSSSNVAKVRSSWDNKIISNCVINAADLFYRFSAVPPALTRLRLYENMAAGSGLDFCIIGVFEGYPDQDSVSAAKEVFRYHAEHQEVYGRLDSLAKLAVLLPLSRRESPAYRGVFRALKELHLPFDCILDARAAAEPSLLERYTTVLVPELGEVLPEALAAAESASKKLV